MSQTLAHEIMCICCVFGQSEVKHVKTPVGYFIKVSFRLLKIGRRCRREFGNVMASETVTDERPYSDETWPKCPYEFL